MLRVRLDFVRVDFIRRAKIKILPHKQSENPLHLRKIQEFYRSNKAEFIHSREIQNFTRATEF